MLKSKMRITMIEHISRRGLFFARNCTLYETSRGLSSVARVFCPVVFRSIMRPIARIFGKAILFFADLNRIKHHSTYIHRTYISNVHIIFATYISLRHPRRNTFTKTNFLIFILASRILRQPKVLDISY